MAIDLPPLLPPQLNTGEVTIEARQSYSRYVRTLGDYQLTVGGDHGLSAAELDAIFERSRSPSEAIQLMNAATYRQGRLLVRYVYTPPRNGIIEVEAVQQSVAAVRGPEPITRYFAALESDRELTRADFDRQRVIANIFAKRSGGDYSISYEESDRPQALDLVFAQSDAEDHSPFSVSASLGNQGSRFAGRYFLDVGLAYALPQGTSVAADFQTALTELGEATDGEDYRFARFSVDHPFTFGLLGLEARHTEYQRDLGSFTETTATCLGPVIGGVCSLPGTTTTTTELELDAEVQQLALSGTQILSSDLDHRLSLSQRLEWTDSQIDASTGDKVQDERYGALELGASYHKADRVAGKRLNWNVAAALKGGLGGDSGTLGSDSTAAGISFGKRSAEFLALKPRASARYAFSERNAFTLDFSAQIANEQLPQQQQWVLGGIDRISAYLPGVLVGDTGYHLDTGLERRWQWGAVELTTAVFAEYGSARFENASGPAGADTDFGHASIADAGLRATIQARDWLEVRAVMAESFHEDNVDEARLERTEADFFLLLKATF